MISCSEAVEQLWEYLEQELDGDRRARIEEHLAFCRRCCGELEFARELRKFLAEAADAGIPADVQTRLTGFLHDLEEGATDPDGSATDATRDGRPTGGRTTTGGADTP